MILCYKHLQIETRLDRIIWSSNVIDYNRSIIIYRKVVKQQIFYFEVFQFFLECFDKGKTKTMKLFRIHKFNISPISRG